ncbi:MAG: type II secretion system F family protein [Candidatus Omnitrophota bacterium]
MPVYIYKAKNDALDAVNGQIEADSREQAVDKISDMGLLAVSVVPLQPTADVPPASSVQRVRAIKIGSLDIDVFTRQLASLIKAGVPLLRALALIGRQTGHNALTGVAGALEQHVRDGKMLSGALAAYPSVFNNLYLNMIRAGERSGTLGEVLFALADYRQKEQDVRQKIMAALAYPLLMITVGFATIFVMLTFFLPKFIVLFEDMNQTLPLATRMLIGLSTFMAANWAWFILAGLLVFMMIDGARHGGKKKMILDMIKLRVPFVKIFVRNAEIARFSRTLGLLIRSGIPVCEGLELATEVLDNDMLKSRLRQARLDIMNQGSSLSASLSNIEVFPDFALNMIAVGEESGKLEWSLTDISDVYEREVEQALKIATTLLEPILILIIGAFVGFIVVAMLLPVFNMGVGTHLR